MSILNTNMREVDEIIGILPLMSYQNETKMKYRMKYEIWNEKYKIYNEKYKMKNIKYKIWNEK